MPLRAVFLLVLVAGTALTARSALADPTSRSVYNLAIDSATYDGLARQLAATWDLGVIPASQPPGFLILLAGIYSVFGHSYVAVKLLFSALLAASALIVGLVGWKRVDPAAGTFAAALTIFSPLLAAYAVTIQYEIPAAFISTLVMALLVRDPRLSSTRSEVAWASITALGCAVAALVREVLIVLLPIAVALAVWRNAHVKPPWRLAAVPLLMLTVSAIPIASWTWVQYRHTGRVVFLSEKSDINLQIGNNLVANGTYHLQLQPISEPSGWRFIRTHPAETVRLAGRKAMYFWGVARDPWTVPQEFATVLSRALLNRVPYQWVLMAVRGGLVAVLFVAGVVALRNRPQLWPVPGVILAVMSVHMLYFGSQRFAVPVQPQIYLVASVALAALARAVARHRRVAVVATALVASGALGAATVMLPGRYRVEAEELEGFSAVNVADPAAAGGVARFAAAGVPRPVAFLSGEAFPRGVFVVRVRARAGNCANPRDPALSVSMRGPDRMPKFNDTFTVGDLCRTSGYSVLSSPGVLRQDDTVYLSVAALGSVDVWVDDVELLFGYRQRRQLPLASPGQ